MPFPTREEAYNIFKLFESPPDGSRRFFEEFVSPNLEFHAIGPPTSSHAAVYHSKEDFLAGGFGKLGKAVKAPGMKFVIPGGIDGITVDEKRGFAAVRFDATDTVTHSGVPYQQHYSWHIRFGEDGIVSHIWAYLDHGYLQEVLGTELERLGIA